WDQVARIAMPWFVFLVAKPRFVRLRVTASWVCHRPWPHAMGFDERRERVRLLSATSASGLERCAMSVETKQPDPPILSPAQSEAVPTWRAAYSDRTSALMALFCQLAHVPFVAPPPRGARKIETGAARKKAGGTPLGRRLSLGGGLQQGRGSGLPCGPGWPFRGSRLPRLGAPGLAH